MVFASAWYDIAIIRVDDDIFKDKIAPVKVEKSDNSDGGDEVNTKEEDVVKEEQNMTRNPSYETAQEEPFEAMDS